MKVKKVTLGIMDPAQGLKEFAAAARSIQAGHVPSARKDAVYFVSVDAFQSVLTTRRLELIRTIRERRPESVYRLAHMLDRHLKNVQQDVALLERLGLVSVSRRKSARRQTVPRVHYDRLQVQIPIHIPLG